MTLKRITVPSALMLLVFSLLSACGGTHSPVVIEMELASKHDDTDPLVIEQLFSVSVDAENVDFEVSLQMKSETCLLEIADNETKEALTECFWREGFNHSGEDKEYITLVNLQKNKEYIIRLTCTEVEQVQLVVTSDSNLVQVRGKPQKPERG